MKQNSIIYVNFSPYENVANILDFILERFKIVILFSLNFHKLGKNQEPSKIKIYDHKRVVKEIPLPQFSYPSSLIFVFLPLRSIIIFIQILWNIVQLKKEYGIFDFYFTFNAFLAWVGNILRRYKLLKKTIYWASDYYPPIHPDKIITFMRWLYWQFDKTTVDCNRLIFINKRLENLRKDIGILAQHKNYPIVPLGTNPLDKLPKKIRLNKLNLCFFGVIKKSQGLDLVFNTENEIIKRFSKIKLHIIGAGPDEEYFKKRTKKSRIETKFYGLRSEEKEIIEIFGKCQIGIAPFIPEEGNVAYYGDPSKIKKYISCGLPVITTNVFSFSKEIAKNKAGIVINYYQRGELLKAIINILSEYDIYRKNALRLARLYDYKKIYPRIFFST